MLYDLFLQKHRELCRKEDVKCSGCDVTVLRCDLDDHQTECPNRQVNCPHCQEHVIYQDLEVTTRFQRNIRRIEIGSPEGHQFTNLSMKLNIFEKLLSMVVCII